VRWGITIACLAVLAGSARASPPPIEDALAHAAAAGKPLIVVFGAAWCAPCRRFETEVLARPDVRDAVAHVELVHYDVDVAPGDAAARRYNVTDLPAFLALASDGSELARGHGIPPKPADARRWFLRFLDHARRYVPSTAELEALVAQHPDDVAARTRLAHHYHAIGRTDDAVAQLDAIVALPGVDRRAAATARAEAQDIELAAQRVAATVAAAVDFVAQFPDAPEASTRIALLAASSRIAPDRLAELARGHLAAVAPRDLPGAVRAALLAGAAGEAELVVARRLAAGTAEHRLLFAEIELMRGRTDPARTRIAAVCATPAGVELWCYQLARAVTDRYSVAPAVQRMHDVANATIAELESPGYRRSRMGDVTDLDERDRDFGNALARGLAVAQHDCADIPRRRERVTIVLEPQHPVRSFGDDIDLRTCIENQLRAVAPASPRDVIYATLAFEPLPAAKQRTLRRADPMLDPARPLEHGVLAFGAARAGPSETATVGVRGRAELLAFGECRLVASAQVEIGSASTTSAVGLGGLACRASPRATVDLGLGYGVSTYGDALPRARELPLEARVRVAIGRMTGHAWADATRILGSSARAHERNGDLISPDEYTVGIGATVPAGALKLFVGVQLEQRIAGTGGTILAGVPWRMFD